MVSILEILLYLLVIAMGIFRDDIDKRDVGGKESNEDVSWFCYGIA